MEKRMGRPPKQTQSRNKSLNIRLTDAELNMINGCAQRLGISRTDAIIKGIELIEQKKIRHSHRGKLLCLTGARTMFSMKYYIMSALFL